MAQPSIDEFASAATKAVEPSFVAELHTDFGVLDPLGLSQINFDLMDQVFPGLNNVARHVRPFVIVSWAWRRAAQLKKETGARKFHAAELQDFVDRIEVLFALSQFLRNDDADLPGREVLAPLLAEDRLTFGGKEWADFRKQRKYSTALSAPAFYGPGLKMLGYLRPHPDFRNIMLPTDEVTPALDALEAELQPAFKHEAFSSLGSVKVSRKDLAKWGDMWSLDEPTSTERRIMRELLAGPDASAERRQGMTLLTAASEYANSTDTNILRAAMCGAPSKFKPPPELVDTRDGWRRLQVRQVFRLSLESLFYWLMTTLGSQPRPIGALVREFLGALPTRGRSNTRDWLRGLADDAGGPTIQLQQLQENLGQRDFADLPHSIALGLAFCLTEPDAKDVVPQRAERLPLSRAQREAAARGSSPVPEFVRHVIESWVLAQHAYWSVNRGLADARRSSDKTLLRLRVILDEGGWALTPGAVPGKAPKPTADRLHTAITLAGECGLFKRGR
jgi:hypothetical protein